MKSAAFTTRSESTSSKGHSIHRSRPEPFFSSRKPAADPFFGSTVLQSKLKINRKDDKFEREANAVADRVMMMPDLDEEESVQMKPAGEEEEEALLMQAIDTDEVMLQQQPAGDEEEAVDMQSAEEEELQMCRADESEEDLQMQPEQEPEEEAAFQMQPVDEEEQVQMKSVSSGMQAGLRTASPELSAKIESTRGNGTPLDPVIQTEMGSKMGADFSGVRIHTGTASVQMAQELGAKAFTVGRDIFFNSGQYQPESAEGKHLLTHELTHTIQQRSATQQSRKIYRQMTFEAVPAPRLTTSGRSVGRLGIVDQDGYSGIDPGLNLRSLPSEHAAILRRMPHNTPLYIQREPIEGWYLVVARDDGSAGYVAKRYVNIQLPDPGARLHRIEGGETALGLARRFFDPSIYEWGADARFYVNVLVFVNREAGRNGIRKPSEDAAWDQTETFAGRQIWIPSIEFARSLRGQVRSGSISYGAWQAIKSAALEAVEFLAGTVAFIGGLIVGALEAVWDAISGIVQLAWGIFKSLITGNIVSDARQLMRQLVELDPGELAVALADWLDARWNHPQLLRRWYWRGWIIGYVIAEVLMLIFSGGAITAAKWAAKTSRIADLIRRLGPIARMTRQAERVRRGERGSRLAERMRTGSRVAFTSLREARDWAARTFRLPAEILRNLTLEGIEQLRRLPSWAVERLRALGPRAKQWLLGCASVCRVDADRIQRTLRSLRGGAEVAAGFAAEHVAAFSRFLARPLTHGDISELGRLWRSVARTDDVARLTLSNSRRLFNNHRRRFWRAVYDNESARTYFERAGCRFGRRGTAPVYELPDGRRIRMSIDHIIERQSAPGRALDPSNLRIVFERENTVMLRLLNQLDPFQRF